MRSLVKTRQVNLEIFSFAIIVCRIKNWFRAFWRLSKKKKKCVRSVASRSRKTSMIFMCRNADWVLNSKEFWNFSSAKNVRKKFPLTNKRNMKKTAKDYKIISSQISCQIKVTTLTTSIIWRRWTKTKPWQEPFRNHRKITNTFLTQFTSLLRL